MTTTLANVLVSKAGVHWPRSGVWSAGVQLVEPTELAGAVELVIDGGLTFKGTVVRGGPIEGSARYLIEGGAGGWRKTIPAKGYRNAAGVKLSEVLGDAAREAGELLELGVPDRSLGVAYQRRQGPAWDVLTTLAGPWWVDAPGVTQVRARPSPMVTAEFRSMRWDRAAGRREISTETVADFAPGALLADDPIEEVQIDVEDGVVRLVVRTSTTARGLLARIIRGELAKLGIVSFHEYRVKSQTGALVTVQAVRKAAGYPDVTRARARPGAAGYSATYHTDSLVLVGFVGADPTRPFIAFADEVGSPGALPDELAIDSRGDLLLGAAAAPVIRAGDTVDITPGNGGGPVAGVITITLGTAETPAAVSRVKA
jgi:hypothetical protein